MKIAAIVPEPWITSSFFLAFQKAFLSKYLFDKTSIYAKLISQQNNG